MIKNGKCPICGSCFKKIYGEIVMHVKNGEYYGGHKFHLAGGKIGDHEIGELYLTKDYLIFIKYHKDPSEIWEIRYQTQIPRNYDINFIIL